MLLALAAGVASSMVVQSVIAQPAPDDATMNSPVPDAAEAERRAGYELFEPSNVPSGYVRGTILVERLEAGPGTAIVTQTWLNPDGGDAEFMELVQAPGLSGIGGTGVVEEVTVGGSPGQRVIEPPREERQWRIVTVYWTGDGGMAFMLTAGLTDTVTPDYLLDVAESLQPTPE